MINLADRSTTHIGEKDMCTDIDTNLWQNEMKTHTFSYKVLPYQRLSLSCIFKTVSFDLLRMSRSSMEIIGY